MKIRITGNGRFFVGQYFAELDTKNINPNGSMDVVQGGTYNPQEDIRKEFSIAMDKAGVNYDWSVYEKNHSFIPSVSSLALLDGYKRDWSSPINRDLVCSSETPFDSYYSPNENEEHVHITASSVEWLLKEIQGNPQPPRYTPTENDFSFSVTSKTLCVGDRANLEAKVKECELPSEITWVVSSNLEIIQQNSSSVDVKVIGNGEAFIKATFQGGAEYTKTFWVGVPELNPIVECSSDDCWKICASTRFNYDNEITVNTVGQLNQQVTEWQWEKVSTNFNMRTIDNTAIFQASQVGYIDFRVRAKNECGWSEWLNRYLKVEKCDINPLREQFFQVYPNPTSYELNIKLINPKNATVIKNVEAELYNLMGQLKKTIKLTDFKGQIYVNDLPKGLYILKINIDGQLETHQVKID